ncbi:MAG: hypothetical protein AAGA46_10290, partial [Cyanobacteria bacterium P01_F01_bin.13]
SISVRYCNNQYTFFCDESSLNCDEFMVNDLGKPTQGLSGNKFIHQAKLLVEQKKSGNLDL